MDAGGARRQRGLRRRHRRALLPRARAQPVGRRDGHRSGRRGSHQDGARGISRHRRVRKPGQARAWRGDERHGVVGLDGTDGAARRALARRYCERFRSEPVRSHERLRRGGDARLRSVHARVVRSGRWVQRACGVVRHAVTFLWYGGDLLSPLVGRGGDLPHGRRVGAPGMRTDADRELRRDHPLRRDPGRRPILCPLPRAAGRHVEWDRPGRGGDTIHADGPGFASLRWRLPRRDRHTISRGQVLALCHRHDGPSSGPLAAALRHRPAARYLPALRTLATRQLAMPERSETVHRRSVDRR